jgi:hypothetical protein
MKKVKLLKKNKLTKFNSAKYLGGGGKILHISSHFLPLFPYI